MRLPIGWLSQILAGLAGLSVCIMALGAEAKDGVIYAGTLIDGVSTTPRDKVSILIRDDRIILVEPGFTTSAGAEIVDLS